MNSLKTGHFPPARRLGLLFHIIIIAVLAAVAIYGFINLGGAPMGPRFVLYLLTALVAFAPIPAACLPSLLGRRICSGSMGSLAAAT